MLVLNGRVNNCLNYSSIPEPSSYCARKTDGIIARSIIKRCTINIYLNKYFVGDNIAKTDIGLITEFENDFV